MELFSFKLANATILKAIAAAAMTLTAIPTAFADINSTGLENLLAEPTSFVAISEGNQGHVTFASMAGNTLAIQFVIPTHAGDTFAEIVGEVDDEGTLFGNSIFIDQDGRGVSTPVTMTFGNDDIILADFADGNLESGFMPGELFNH